MFLRFFLYILCCVIAYLLGSFNFAIFISKKFYNKNIKKLGSKNAGATNMLVNFGKPAALVTLFGDALKGFMSVFICKIVCSKIMVNANNIVILEYFVLFFALIGHIFPIFYKFKGGKGIAVTAGAMIFIDVKIFLTLITVFIIIFKFSKIVSLSSLSATVFYPILTFVFNYYNYKISTKITLITTIISTIVSIIIIFAHKKNIKRLIERKEIKIKK